MESNSVLYDLNDFVGRTSVFHEFWYVGIFQVASLYKEAYFPLEPNWKLLIRISLDYGFSWEF